MFSVISNKIIENKVPVRSEFSACISVHVLSIIQIVLYTYKITLQKYQGIRLVLPKYRKTIVFNGPGFPSPKNKANIKQNQFYVETFQCLVQVIYILD